MKFSTAFALTMVASTSAASLRASSRMTEFAPASISIVGLKTEPSSEDLEVVAESIVAAYNELYVNPELQAIAFETKSGAVVASEVSELTNCPKCLPDDDSMLKTKQVISAMIIGRVGLGNCPKCLPDDDQTVMATKVANCPKCLPDDDLAISVQEAFNARVCHKLRTSVSSNFANVHDCDIQVDEDANKASVYGLLSKAASA